MWPDTGQIWRSDGSQELPRSGRLAALPARGSGPTGPPGVNAGAPGPPPCQGTTGTMGRSRTAGARRLAARQGGVWSSSKGSEGWNAPEKP